MSKHVEVFQAHQEPDVYFDKENGLLKITAYHFFDIVQLEFFEKIIKHTTGPLADLDDYKNMSEAEQNQRINELEKYLRVLTNERDDCLLELDRMYGLKKKREKKRNRSKYRLCALNVEYTTEPGKYFDGDGLFLFVTEKGSKLWRLKYRIAGKEKLGSLGAWPVVSLKDARLKAAEWRKKISQGIDPIHKEEGCSVTNG